MAADSPVVAERLFTFADLTAFADLSGDHNPLHVDPVAARRTHFGDCVVHGVFQLMWALETLEEGAAVHRAWARVDVRFLRPVVVGASVSLYATESNDGKVTLTLQCGGRTAMHCDLTFAAALTATPSPLFHATTPRTSVVIRWMP